MEKEELKLVKPTLKPMLANGAVLENEVLDEINLSKSGIIQRYWIEL